MDNEQTQLSCPHARTKWPIGGKCGLRCDCAKLQPANKTRILYLSRRNHRATTGKSFKQSGSQQKFHSIEHFLRYPGIQYDCPLCLMICSNCREIPTMLPSLITPSAGTGHHFHVAAETASCHVCCRMDDDSLLKHQHSYHTFPSALVDLPYGHDDLKSKNDSTTPLSRIIDHIESVEETISPSTSNPFEPTPIYPAINAVAATAVNWPNNSTFGSLQTDDTSSNRDDSSLCIGVMRSTFGGTSGPANAHQNSKCARGIDVFSHNRSSKRRKLSSTLCSHLTKTRLQQEPQRKHGYRKYYEKQQQGQTLNVVREPLATEEEVNQMGKNTRNGEKSFSVVTNDEQYFGPQTLYHYSGSQKLNGITEQESSARDVIKQSSPELSECFLTAASSMYCDARSRWGELSKAFPSFDVASVAPESMTPEVPVAQETLQTAASAVSMEKSNTSEDNTSSVATASDSNHRFRAYQVDLWTERFKDLLQFKKIHGHCRVPHYYHSNPHLAQCVKRQRFQYKRKRMQCHSTLSDARQQDLEAIGFIWDSHQAAWYERFDALKKYCSIHGHCRVPPSYEQDRALVAWMKYQRRQYKLYLSGKRSALNAERIKMLNDIGFDWDPRHLHKKASSSDDDASKTTI